MKNIRQPCCENSTTLFLLNFGIQNLSFQQKMVHQSKSVCVIGAGAGGLCALRHFTTMPEKFNPVVCYEQTDKVGGLWNYTENIDKDQNGLPIHSSMYRDMK